VSWKPSPQATWGSSRTKSMNSNLRVAMATPWHEQRTTGNRYKE
jgi:hypothetical protein